MTILLIDPLTRSQLSPIFLASGCKGSAADEFQLRSRRRSGRSRRGDERERVQCVQGAGADRVEPTAIHHAGARSPRNPPPPPPHPRSHAPPPLQPHRPPPHHPLPPRYAQPGEEVGGGGDGGDVQYPEAAGGGAPSSTPSHRRQSYTPCSRSCSVAAL